MGFLDLFKRSSEEPEMMRLPSGTFTVDAEGRILSSTVPQWFPSGQLREMGQQVVKTFRTAAEAHLRFSELVIHFASFKITARELRGGAIIFLAPKTLQSTRTKI